MITIKMMDFISKLGDAYFVIYNTLSIIKREDVQSLIVQRMMQGSDRLLQELVDAKVFNHDTPGKINELKGNVLQRMKDLNLQKVQEYEPILLNQNLVMLCTIMEIYFLHILETIMIKDQKTIIGLALDKTISLDQIIALKNYEAVIEDFRSKILDHFSKQGLKEKFKIYEKIMPDINNIFDFSAFTEDVQHKFSTYDLIKLNEVFNKRHNIVHKNEFPLKTLSELSDIKDFFEKLILNLSTFVMNKYSILLDIQEPLVSAGFPIEKMPGQSKAKLDN